MGQLRPNHPQSHDSDQHLAQIAPISSSHVRNWSTLAVAQSCPKTPNLVEIGRMWHSRTLCQTLALDPDKCARNGQVQDSFAQEMGHRTKTFLKCQPLDEWVVGERADVRKDGRWREGRFESNCFFRSRLRMEFGATPANLCEDAGLGGTPQIGVLTKIRARGTYLRLNPSLERHFRRCPNDTPSGFRATPDLSLLVLVQRS